MSQRTGCGPPRGAGPPEKKAGRLQDGAHGSLLPPKMCVAVEAPLRLLLPPGKGWAPAPSLSEASVCCPRPNRPWRLPSLHCTPPNQPRLGPSSEQVVSGPPNPNRNSPPPSNPGQDAPWPPAPGILGRPARQGWGTPWAVATGGAASQVSTEGELMGGSPHALLRLQAKLSSHQAPCIPPCRPPSSPGATLPPTPAPQVL